MEKLVWLRVVLGPKARVEFVRVIVEAVNRPDRMVDPTKVEFVKVTFRFAR